MNTPSENITLPKTAEQYLKDARESIGLLSCQMETCMTDGSKGDKYQAVSMGVVNQWFDILDKRISEALTNARREERERILAGIEPLIADLNAAVKTFKKHGMVKTAREMKENIGYLIYLVNGYTAEDALRKVNQEAQSSEEEK